MQIRWLKDKTITVEVVSHSFNEITRMKNQVEEVTRLPNGQIVFADTRMSVVEVDQDDYEIISNQIEIISQKEEIVVKRETTLRINGKEFIFIQRGTEEELFAKTTCQFIDETEEFDFGEIKKEIERTKRQQD